MRLNNLVLIFVFLVCMPILFSQEKSNESDAAKLLKAGNEELSHGNYGLARKHLNKLVELFPEKGSITNVHLLLAHTWYSEKNYTKAITEYRIVANDTQSEHAPKALLKIGNCYLKKGEHANALITYWRLLNFYPTCSQRHVAKTKIEQIKIRMDKIKK